MKRLLTLVFAVLCVLASAALNAQSTAQQNQALQQALLQGAERAVTSLGAQDGFYNNPTLKIPLPGKLEKGAKVLKMAGMGKDVEKLELAINEAASLAVAEAKPILANSLQQMTVQDAAGILRGANNAGTEYFRRSSESALAERFLPIVASKTQQVGLADQYNKIAAPAAQYGLIDPKQGDLNSYVTAKALDGLFHMIAQEEQAIRQNPAGQANKLLQSVFGGLQR